MEALNRRIFLSSMENCFILADLVPDTTILDKVKTADTSSEIDLEETVEEIRQHTLETMKPEIAP